jgi:anaerobic C4-dicarboxylate transporter
MREMIRSKLVKHQSALALAIMAVMVGGQAGAVGADFSTILSGLDATTATTAVLAAAVILAAVGFAVWGAKKVGKFFG